MKTDWRICGRPYRGARRTITLKSGFPTKDAAEAALATGVAAGDLDPYAWVQSRQVLATYDPVLAEQRRRIPMA